MDGFVLERAYNPHYQPFKWIGCLKNNFLKIRENDIDMEEGIFMPDCHILNEP